MDTVDINDEGAKGARIAKKMLHEHASLWYISDPYGSKVMIKVPSVAIKALMKGCLIEFLFGKDTVQQPALFHTGFRIYDDPVHYLLVTGVQRFRDEHTSLEKIMHGSYTYIHFYNELNVCMATATLTFNLKDQLRVLNLLGKPDTLSTGAFDKVASASLDCFQHILQSGIHFENVTKIDTLILEGQLTGWKMMKNHFLGPNGSSKMVADDANEGGLFEKEVLVALESLFDDQVYKSPQVVHKKGTREWTDLFAFSEYGLFLVETKALGILATARERTMERKVKGLQQQIEKAISRLTGAVRKITAKNAVFDANGNEILFNKELLPHCVVLVSELLPFGDWKEIELKMMVAMMETRMYLHVMDLKEFMRYIGMSRGSKDRLDYMLMERAKSFVEHQTIHLTAKEIFPGKENS